MRIAVVNDMPMAVEALRRAISRRPEWQIAWTARDGAEAVAKCAADTPDIVLMDLIMPVMDGAKATKEIMRSSPCAILVVTATVEGNMPLVFEAMGNGALDAVNTPVLGAGGKLSGSSELEGKIAMIGKIIPKPGQPPPALVAMEGRLPPAHTLPPLIAIGASTGGPAALMKIIRALPEDFGAALAVVQHVDRVFSGDLAAWLASQSRLPVRVAEEGCRPERGVVLIAGTNDHLVMTSSGVLSYSREPAANWYRPSVDVFFHSVARYWHSPGAAVVLTGMGRDGAEGLLSLRKSGWTTIAQDRQSSVVFGMPKAAAECGAAAQIMPVDLIGPELVSLIMKNQNKKR